MQIVVGSTTAALGGAVLDLVVGGGIPGVLIGPLGASVLEVIAAADHRGAERAERTAHEAAVRAGITPEALVAWAEADERHMDLLVKIVQAALRAREERRVGVLARVLAEGVQDDAEVDVLALIAQARGGFGPAHLQVLDSVANNRPPHRRAGPGRPGPAWPMEQLTPTLPTWRTAWTRWWPH